MFFTWNHTYRVKSEKISPPFPLTVFTSENISGKNFGRFFARPKCSWCFFGWSEQENLSPENRFRPISFKNRLLNVLINVFIIKVIKWFNSQLGSCLLKISERWIPWHLQAEIIQGSVLVFFRPNLNSPVEISPLKFFRPKKLRWILGFRVKIYRKYTYGSFLNLKIGNNVIYLSAII